MLKITQKIGLFDIQKSIVHSLLVENAEISDAVDLILRQGALHRASDIHFEGHKDILRIRYRIDGFFQNVVSLPLDLQERVIARLKVLADLPPHERQEPQDGRFSVIVGDRRVDYRINIMPTVTGEKAVVRILDPKTVLYQIDQLGFDPQALETLKRVLTNLRGMILVAGPAGSGKTTSMYAFLLAIHNLKGDFASLITIEDPVEFNLGLFPQVQVNRKRGIDFASGLRAILRQDPQVIMVGEIRDVETCEMALRAGLTGHMVISTVHSATACEVVTRLLDMGMQPFVVASSISALIALRLVRVNCKHCLTPYTPNPTFLSFLPKEAEPEKIKFLKGKGCPQCLNTGFMGRTSLTELLVVNEPIRKQILTKASTSTLFEEAKKHGMVSLLDDGISKVKQGITTIEEVARILGAEVDYQ